MLPIIFLKLKKNKHCHKVVPPKKHCCHLKKVGEGSFPTNYRYTIWKYSASSEVQHLHPGKSILFKAQIFRCVLFKEKRTFM